MAGLRGLRIGIALGEATAVAVVQGTKAGPVVQASGDFLRERGDLDRELRRAFGELKTGLEAAGAPLTQGARVNVTLLPPLADTRLLSFPPMRREEIQTVLTRDVARYFLGADQPRVVGVQVPPKGGNGNRRANNPTVSVVASSTPLDLLERIRGALMEVGWRSGSFSSAQGLWLSTAQAMRGSSVDALIALVEESAHIWSLKDGEPQKARQVKASDPAHIQEALGIGPGRVLLLAPGEARESLRQALSRSGWDVLPDPEGWAHPSEAAAFRAGSGGVELTPPSLAQEKKEKRRKDALYLLAGAVVLLLASAGAQLWGVNRELGAVQEQRALIRQEVAPLLLARESLAALRGRLEALRELEVSAPVWTRSLVELTVALPGDTYLTSFFASGDTLELEAAGTGAGEAIQILRESGLFEDLRLQGVVEREMEGGETVRERFSLRGRLPTVGAGGGS